MPRRFKSHARPVCEVGSPDRGYESRRASDEDLARSAGIRNSAQWQRMRAMVRGEQPICPNPYGDHDPAQPVLGESIHHILGLDQYPELAFVRDNLVNLCWHCHNKAEAEIARPSRREMCVNRFIPPALVASLLKISAGKKADGV